VDLRKLLDLRKANRYGTGTLMSVCVNDLNLD